MNVLRDTIQTARRDYPCDACFAFSNSNYGEIDVDKDDWKTVITAENDKYKIKRGSKYRKIVYVDGDIWTYRARIDMDNICQKYELFNDN